MANPGSLQLALPLPPDADDGGSGQDNRGDQEIEGFDPSCIHRLWTAEETNDAGVIRRRKVCTRCRGSIWIGVNPSRYRAIFG